MKRSFKYGIFRLVLVGLLLFAQQAALTHEAEHAHDHEAPSQQSEDGKHFHSGLCAFHSVLAGVLGMAGASAPSLCIASNAVEHRVNYVLVSAPVDAVIPVSRGPPILL
ncbi:MAG TPA: hypothetical protein VMT94_02580 [Burkholderiales bacterium]|nr:hypothetical protein [Burkholderiales bacterium]